MRTSGRGNDLLMVVIPSGVFMLLAWYMFGSSDFLRQVDSAIEHVVLALVNSVRSLF